MKNHNINNIKIAVIGLGYVGLPLARLFATKYPVIGYDINEQRVKELQQGNDTTLEVDKTTLSAVIKDSPNISLGLHCSKEISSIADCNYFIVTVPTPVDETKRPNLRPLYKASEAVGSILKKGDIVIYESTVYPGVTEEECVPTLEKHSNLTFNVDFFVGYSPERINPGDKEHTIEKILKVTAGSTPEIAKKVNALYNSVISAGTFMASSIKVAEAAKVIENSQRDINIAFVNELSKIFKLMEIDTHDVLEAAATKWNFLPFKPGLVGGHCIGVDPYYLAQKAQQHGYHPEIILSGRRMNDSMGEYVSSEVIRLMIGKNINVKSARILILGLTFKENCPDIRNTKAIDVIESLKKYDAQIEVYDPWADEKEVCNTFNIKLLDSLEKEKFDAVVLTVAHDTFLELDFQKLLKPEGVLYDVKSILPCEVSGRL